MIDLTPVLQALAALGGAIITGVIIPLIRGKTSAHKLERLQAWARIAVKAAEQLHPGCGVGRAKKIYALGLLSEHVFTADTAVLGALIECEVNRLNCEKCTHKEDTQCHF